MKQIFKKFSIAATISLALMALLVGLTSHQPVYADAKSDACQGVNLATGGGTAGCGTAAQSNGSVDKLLSTIINILSLVVGVIAVIMIIIGGMRFVLSGGDSNNTNSARNSIIYSIVGLVIVALAQVIVHFVLNRVQS